MRGAFKEHKGGPLFEFPENLENTFDTKEKPSPVPDAIRALRLMDGALDAAQIRPEIIELDEEIRRTGFVGPR